MDELVEKWLNDPLTGKTIATIIVVIFVLSLVCLRTQF